MLGCPTDDTVHAFLAGHLSLAEASDFQAHLVQCQACLDLLVHLVGAEPSGDVLPEFAATLAAAPPPTTSGGPRLLDQLPEAGQRFGPYLLHRQLGRGGMGAVYEAEHLESGRRVALKVLLDVHAGPADRRRFLREGRLAAALSHPRCVYVYGTEEIADVPVITMELVPGGTLEDLRRRGPLPPSTAVGMMLQVIDGLEAAAGIGVLHRDIKPSNCFLGTDGHVKVGDFGLSISLHARDESQLTPSGALIGTPAFSSPEQVRGAALDVRSDIYSVGATLYSLLTGRLPLQVSGGGLVQVIAAVLEQTPPSPRSLVPAIPRGLSDVVMRCLKKDQAARFGSYQDLRRELMPFTALPLTPASPWLRMLGGVLDQGLTTLLTGLWLLLWRGTGWVFDVSQQRTLFFLLSISLIRLAYYALLEGGLGASLGKALCGVRVAGPEGGAPGLGRSLVRAAIFCFSAVPPHFYFVYLMPLDSSFRWRWMVIYGAIYGLMGLLFLPARRANGFAALHDRASGTRVVLQASGELHRPNPRPATALPATGAMRLGPYLVAGTGPAAPNCDGLVPAYDSQLRREVWLHLVPAGTPPLLLARQRLERPGRLRWLNGRRTVTEAWDAYEAAPGQALRQVAPVGWGTARRWLLELGEELLAGSEDESLPRQLGPDHVWVCSDGSVRLLDSLPPGLAAGPGARGAIDPADPEAARGLLHRIALLATAGDGLVPPRPLPLHAGRLLASLGSAECSGRELVRRLGQAATLPAAVTAARRLGPLVISSFLLVNVLLVTGLLGAQIRLLSLGACWSKSDQDRQRSPACDQVQG